MITTKIYIKPHLAEYVVSKFGTPDGFIRFPDSLDIYHVIWDLTERRPVRCRPDDGNVEIILPDRSIGKAPETYNYISRKSQRIISRYLENIFLTELHAFVFDEKHRKGNPYNESVYRFICRYEIESITEDALKKNCYRWINRFQKRQKRAYGKQNILTV